MSAPRPKQADDLEAHEVEDGLVVYHSGTQRVHYLNPVASVVFELCSGDHTDDEIVTLVGEAWGLPEPPDAEVRQCLAQLREEGVIV